jgi:hypothetical protein
MLTYLPFSCATGQGRRDLRLRRLTGVQRNVTLFVFDVVLERLLREVDERSGIEGDWHFHSYFLVFTTPKMEDRKTHEY